MKKLNNSSLLIILIIQIVIIIIVSLNIFIKIKNSSLNISINPIKKENISFKPNTEVKYFYELNPASVQYDQEYGKVDWLDKQAKYTINSDGLNERFQYQIKKPVNTFRIITLGDSFTYGSYVDTSDNWTEKLEDLLNTKLSCNNFNKYEVINLGVYGYDIQYSYERFKDKGKKYNPDLIIWFIKDDDLSQLNEVMLPKVFDYKKQMEKNGELAKKLKGGDIYPYWTEAIKDTYNTIGEDKITNIQLKYMMLLKSSYKGNLLIMTFPFTKPNYINFLKNFTKNNKRTFLFDNLTNIYRNKSNFYQDSHPTIKGHQIIANNLFDYLTKNKIILCN